MLCSLLLPPLVIGLLLIFMVGPYTPIGELLGSPEPVRDQHLPRPGHRRGVRIGALLRAERAGRVHRRGPAAGAAGRAAGRPAGPGLPPGHAAAGHAGAGHGPVGGVGAGDGRVRRRDHHRLPPVRHTVADLHDAAGDGAAPRRCRSPWSCWWSRCRCRWPPTSGARVLDADVEVDRRDFTVRASFASPPGERLALFGPSGAGKTTILEVIAGLVAPRRGRVVLGERVLTSTSPPVPRCPRGNAGRPAAPGPRPVPAPVRAGQPGLRGRGRRAGAGRDGRRCSAWAGC